MENFDTVLSLIDTLGTLGLLVWLVIAFRGDLKNEQQAHENTRRDYREDLRDMANLNRASGAGDSVV